LRLGDPVCGKALLDTETAFGIGFNHTWCPPGLKTNNPYFGVFGGSCVNQQGREVAKQGVGTSGQKEREIKFWKANPHLIAQYMQ
jgi:hypothetical protein